MLWLSYILKISSKSGVLIAWISAFLKKSSQTSHSCEWIFEILAKSKYEKLTKKGIFLRKLSFLNPSKIRFVVHESDSPISIFIYENHFSERSRIKHIFEPKNWLWNPKFAIIVSVSFFGFIKFQKSIWRHLTGMPKANSYKEFFKKFYKIIWSLQDSITKKGY